MSEHSLYRRIIAGETGAWASPVRGVLRAAEEAYKVCITLWNRRYDHWHSHRVLPMPILSVGNITVGGTGKTPLVIDLVRRLEAMGCNPAVVSRGYKAAADEPNDEERLIRTCWHFVWLIFGPRQLSRRLRLGLVGCAGL